MPGMHSCNTLYTKRSLILNQQPCPHCWATQSSSRKPTGRRRKALPYLPMAADLMPTARKPDIDLSMLSTLLLS